MEPFATMNPMIRFLGPPLYSPPIYRWAILSRANIFIRPGPLPEFVRWHVGLIMQREITEERESELSYIAKQLGEAFTQPLAEFRNACDSVLPVRNALLMMNTRWTLTSPRGAGISSLHSLGA